VLPPGPALAVLGTSSRLGAPMINARTPALTIQLFDACGIRISVRKKESVPEAACHIGAQRGRTLCIAGAIGVCTVLRGVWRRTPTAHACPDRFARNTSTGPSPRAGRQGKQADGADHEGYQCTSDYQPAESLFHHSSWLKWTAGLLRSCDNFLKGSERTAIQDSLLNRNNLPIRNHHREGRGEPRDQVNDHSLWGTKNRKTNVLRVDIACESSGVVGGDCKHVSRITLPH
jgi:hypothetical protein